MSHDTKEDIQPQVVVGRYREAAPQILATAAKNLLIFNCAVSFAFVIVAVGVLKNAKEGLSLDDEQVSWLAGTLSFCQPVGSVLSGVIVGYLGRKRSMMALTVPYTAAWLIVFWAESPTAILAATAIIGICFGLTEAPAKTYAGEICQPKLRGSLTAFTGIFVHLGVLLELLLATCASWRTLAAINLAFPIMAVVCIAMIPESPIWLVSKGRIEEAEAALCWLRGWVPPNTVRGELNELVRYYEASVTNKPTSALNYSNKGCLSFARAFFTRETLLPLGMVLVFFLIEHLSVGSGMQMYIVLVYTELQVPMGPYWTKITIKSVSIVMTLVLTFMVPRFGKRRMALASLLGMMVCNLTIGGYAHARWVSPWVAQLVIITACSFAELGLAAIPWMLLSEIFPFRTRGVASGLAGALSHLMIFICAKTFLSLVGAVGLSGVYWLYGCVSALGLAYIYWCLPETEGRTQEEIEKFFSSRMLPDNGSPEELVELRVGVEVKEECLIKSQDDNFQLVH